LRELFLDPNFWASIVQLSWPIAVVVIALIFKKYIAAIFNREKLSFKVAGMEISVTEATEQAGKSISDIQERLARIEQHFLEAPMVLETREEEKKISILWVDDFPSNNAFIIEKLEEEGMRIRKELSTESGIKAIANDSFDLIISDLGRVESGRENLYAGLEFTRAVRASGNQVPLLIFAGPRALDNERQLLAAGSTAVTASPVDVFKFVEKYGKQNIRL
jgi:CheY-like chemotaxis protein